MLSVLVTVAIATTTIWTSYVTSGSYDFDESKGNKTEQEMGELERQDKAELEAESIFSGAGWLFDGDTCPSSCFFPRLDAKANRLSPAIRLADKFLAYGSLNL